MASGHAQKVPNNSWVGPQSDQGGWYLTNGLTPSPLSSSIHLLNTGLVLNSGDGVNAFGQIGLFDTHAQLHHTQGGIIRDFFQLGTDNIQLQMDGGGGVVMNPTQLSWFDQFGSAFYMDSNGLNFTAYNGKYLFQAVPIDQAPNKAIGIKNNELVQFDVPTNSVKGVKEYNFPSGDPIDVDALLFKQVNIIYPQATFTINAPTNPTSGDKIIYRINGSTNVNINWDLVFNPVVNPTPPTSINTGEILYVGVIYDATFGYWDIVSEVLG